MEPLIRSTYVIDEPVLLPSGKKTQEPRDEPPTPLAGEAQDALMTPPIAEPQAAYVPQERCDAEEALRQETERAERLARETEAAVEEARERGYRDGYDAGHAEGEKVHAARVAELDALVASAALALKNGIEGVEDVSVEIVFEAICRILGDAMVQEEAVVLLVKEVIGRVKDRQSLIIRVSPGDYELLQRHRAKLSSLAEGNVELVADDRVVLGGCLLEAAGGSLDGRLEVQIHQLKETLLGVRTRRSEMNSSIL